MERMIKVRQIGTNVFGNKMFFMFMLSVLGVLFVSGLVVAGVLLVQQAQTKVTTSPSVTLVHNFPATQSVFAGDFYNHFEANVTNSGNQQQNYRIVFNATVNRTLSNGDLKLRLMNSSFDVIGSSAQVVGNSVLLDVGDSFLPQQFKKYNASVEINTTLQPSEINLTFAVVAGNFSFH